MRRLLYALLLGVIGAGIVHIAILFMVPGMATSDAWSRLARGAGLFEITRLANTSPMAGQAGVADPFMQAVACRFDLMRGVAHVAQTGRIPFWSASVYGRDGQNIYSLNDRSARDGNLDLVVLTPAQMVDLRKSPLDELEKAVFIEAPISEGIVVVRGFAPDPTWTRAVADYLDGIGCTPRLS